MKKTELIPLTVLEAADKEIAQVTRIQKLCFLVQENCEYPEEYAFVPYDYGPFANQCYSDIENLVDRGLVKKGSWDRDKKAIREYELTDEGRYWLEELKEKHGFNDSEKVEKIVSKWKNQNLTELLNYVYSEYPEYASESVI